MAWWLSGTFPVGKRGMIRVGGTASRSAIIIALLTLAGGDIVAPTTKNKPAWVSPVANSQRPGWSLSVQACTPLESQRTIHSPESIEGAGRRPRCLALPDMEQIDPAIKDIQMVSRRDLPSPLPQFRAHGGL